MSIVIVGAGPNLGAALARRFAREDMPVGLISRNRDARGSCSSGHACSAI